MSQYNVGSTDYAVAVTPSDSTVLTPFINSTLEQEQ